MPVDAPPEIPERSGAVGDPVLAREGRDLVDIMRDLAVLRDAEVLSEADFKRARRMAVAARQPPARR